MDGGRVDLNDVHHALILMAEDVAVEHESASDVATEIHSQPDARIGAAAIPGGQIDRIEILTLDARCRRELPEIILTFHLKVDLMDVEFMTLVRSVLNGPFLNCPDVRHDGGGHV